MNIATRSISRYHSLSRESDKIRERQGGLQTDIREQAVTRPLRQISRVVCAQSVVNDPHPLQSLMCSIRNLVERQTSAC